MKKFILVALALFSNIAISEDEIKDIGGNFDYLFIGVLIEDKNTAVDKLLISDIIVGSINNKHITDANDAAINMERINRNHRSSRVFIFGGYKDNKGKFAAYVDNNGMFPLVIGKKNIKLSLDQLYEFRQK